jgi:hypothetical protein
MIIIIINSYTYANAETCMQAKSPSQVCRAYWRLLLLLLLARFLYSRL